MVVGMWQFEINAAEYAYGKEMPRRAKGFAEKFPRAF